MSAPSRTPGCFGLHAREWVLFANFFLVILAYYEVKPASRSLYIDYIGADNLPYVWIGTALTLGLIINFYQGLVARMPRVWVIIGTNLLCVVGLLGFWVALRASGSPDTAAVIAVLFYVYVDILSVVLVEQFWSLTNTLYSTAEGKRVYGFIGTGGLLGGAVGGAVATLLLKQTPLTTEDLLLVAALVLVVVAVLNAWMARANYYAERSAPEVGGGAALQGAVRGLAPAAGAPGRRGYLWMIAGLLLLAQLAEPVVEYQLSRGLEEAYSSRDARTEFLAQLFTVLSLVSIGVNLLLTPVMHRYLGVIAGLATQPLLLLLAAAAYLWQPTLYTCSVMKVVDRGLSYSINRASKELLYVLVDPLVVYRAKAWIDMFGYRAFKVLGALLILVFSKPESWLAVSYPALTSITLAVCLVWLVLVWRLGFEYRSLHARLS